MSTADVEVLELAGERTPIRKLLRDLYRHRALLPLMARHDYRSRYRSASLGLAWSIFLPLLQGVVIAIVFGKLIGGGKQSTYVPYVLSGISAWTFVQQSLGSASTTIVDSAAIAGRIYFPRLLLPAIPPSANLPGLVISMLIAQIVTAAVGGGVHLTLLLLPVLVVVEWLLVVSAAAIATLAHVYSRDVRYVVQALLLMLFYAVPIIYALAPSEGRRALPESLRPYVLANPGTGIVQLAREVVIGHADYLGTALWWTAGWTVGFLLLAVALYSKFERIAVDRL